MVACWILPIICAQWVKYVPVCNAIKIRTVTFDYSHLSELLCCNYKLCRLALDWLWNVWQLVYIEKVSISSWCCPLSSLYSSIVLNIEFPRTVLLSFIWLFIFVYRYVYYLSIIFKCLPLLSRYNMPIISSILPILFPFS